MSYIGPPNRRRTHRFHESELNNNGGHYGHKSRRNAMQDDVGCVERPWLQLASQIIEPKADYRQRAVALVAAMRRQRVAPGEVQQ